MPRFWRNWLLTVSALMAFMGAFMGVLSVTAITSFTGLFDRLFWPDAGPDAGTVRFQRYVIGGAGGVMAAWGILLYALARWAFAHLDRAVLNALAASAIAWFVLDSAAKIAAEATLFVAGNVPLLVALLLPLVRGSRMPPPERTTA